MGTLPNDTDMTPFTGEMVPGDSKRGPTDMSLIFYYWSYNKTIKSSSYKDGSGTDTQRSDSRLGLLPPTRYLQSRGQRHI